MGVEERTNLYRVSSFLLYFKLHIDSSPGYASWTLSL